MHQPYEKRLGHPADFKIRYRSIPSWKRKEIYSAAGLPEM